MEAERERFIKTCKNISFLLSCASYVFTFFLHCQAIQRQLEEVAEKQRDVEERGVAIEKIIRGETGMEQCLLESSF